MTSVGGDVVPVKPSGEKQGTGVVVSNPDAGTSVSATDEDGNTVPAVINPDTGVVEVTPGVGVDGPITVVVTDPDLPGGSVSVEVPVEGHDKGRDDNGNGQPTKPGTGGSSNGNSIWPWILGGAILGGLASGSSNGSSQPGGHAGGANHNGAQQSGTGNNTGSNQAAQNNSGQQSGTSAQQSAPGAQSGQAGTSGKSAQGANGALANTGVSGVMAALAAALIATAVGVLLLVTRRRQQD